MLGVVGVHPLCEEFLTAEWVVVGDGGVIPAQLAGPVVFVEDTRPEAFPVFLAVAADGVGASALVGALALLLGVAFTLTALCSPLPACTAGACRLARH
jgi:hypothetical protein